MYHAYVGREHPPVNFETTSRLLEQGSMQRLTEMPGRTMLPGQCGRHNDQPRHGTIAPGQAQANVLHLNDAKLFLMVGNYCRCARVPVSVTLACLCCAALHGKTAALISLDSDTHIDILSGPDTKTVPDKRLFLFVHSG